jgi:hypothetical protein
MPTACHRASRAHCKEEVGHRGDAGAVRRPVNYVQNRSTSWPLPFSRAACQGRRAAAAEASLASARRSSCSDRPARLRWIWLSEAEMVPRHGALVHGDHRHLHDVLDCVVLKAAQYACPTASIGMFSDSLKCGPGSAHASMGPVCPIVKPLLV